MWEQGRGCVSDQTHHLQVWFILVQVFFYKSGEEIFDQFGPLKVLLFGENSKNGYYGNGNARGKFHSQFLGTVCKLFQTMCCLSNLLRRSG